MIMRTTTGSARSVLAVNAARFPALMQWRLNVWRPGSSTPKSHFALLSSNAR